MLAFLVLEDGEALAIDQHNGNNTWSQAEEDEIARYEETLLAAHRDGDRPWDMSDENRLADYLGNDDDSLGLSDGEIGESHEHSESQDILGSVHHATADYWDDLSEEDQFFG